MKGFRWKIITGILGVTLVVGGTATVYDHYRAGEFQPNTYAEDRQRNDNQIVFPGQDNAVGDQPSDNSELWKQDDHSDENLKPEDRPTSSVLFQTLQIADSQQVVQPEEQTKQQEKQPEDQDKVYAPGSTDDNDSKTPGNTVKKDPSSDNGGNNHNSNNGDNGNEPGNNNNSSNTTTEDHTPSNPAGPSDADKPSDSNHPSNPDTPKDPDKDKSKDKDTTVPVAPKDDSIISTDHYPGDDKIDIKSDEDYKKYSLKIIGNQSGEDEANNLYCGEYLNDLRVFYSTKVYLCIDGNPVYRLMELNENFKLGEYPERVAEDADEITLTYYYRPGAEYDWIKGTYTEKIEYSAKVLLQSWTDGEYIKQYMVRKNSDCKVALFPYYYQMTHQKTSLFDLKAAEAVTKLFNGWSETEKGASVGPYYMVEGTGVKLLYPTTLQDAGTDYKINWLYSNYGGYHRLQTMTDDNREIGEDTALTVPEGVERISLDAGDPWLSPIRRNYKKVTLPASVLQIDKDSWGQAFNGFTVRQEYEVDEKNVEYSSYNGMLLNKEQTEIYDIPTEMTEITVPDTVQKIQFNYINQISKVYFTAEVPGKFDFSNLHDAEIHVPASSYMKYLAAWGKNPGKWNVLIADGEEIGDFKEDDEGIYSSDGKTLVSAKVEVSGTYVVPEGIETIAEGAFDNCGTIDLLILPKSLKKLEDNSLSGDNAPGKIVFLGEEAPEIAENTFADSSILQVLENAKSSYQEKWSTVIGDRTDTIHYREFSYTENGTGGFDYLEEGACEDGQCEEGAILIKAPAGLTTFKGDMIAGLHCKEIAARAFAGCEALVVAELPASIHSIGREAFADCPNLEGVISEATDRINIGENAFDGDMELRWLAWNAESITIDGDGHGAYAEEFAVRNSNGGDYGMNCYSPVYEMEDVADGYLLYGRAVSVEGNATKYWYLVGATTTISGEVSLRDYTMEITPKVFANCPNAFTIIGWDQVEYIDWSAFWQSGIAGEISLAGTTKTIGMNAFYGCSNITKVTIDGSQILKNGFGYNAFAQCKGLKKAEFVGTGEYDIASSTFAGCTALTSITFAKNVGIESIGYEAFSSTAITTLTLPQSVTSIGTAMIAGCTKLEKLTFTSQQPPLPVRYDRGTRYFFSEGDDDGFIDGKLVVPEGQEQAYIDEWRYYVLGYGIEDAGKLTKEQLLEGENMVRRYLGLDPVSLEEKDEEQTEISVQNAKPDMENTSENAVSDETTENTSGETVPEDKSAETSTEETSSEQTTEAVTEDKKEAETTENTEQTTQEEDTEE